MKRWALLFGLLLLSNLVFAEQIALTGKGLAPEDSVALPIEATFTDSQGKVYLVTMRKSGVNLVLLLDDDIQTIEEELPPPVIFMPTTVEGRVVDERRNPAGGVKVAAEWTDSEGKRYRVETTTMTREEAVAIGDTGLVGYYSFNDGRITAPPNQPIKITAGESTQIVTSLPGGRRLVPESSVQQGEISGGIVLSFDSQSMKEWFAEHWKGIVILFVGLLMIVGVMAVMRSSGKQETSLSYRLKRFRNSKASQFLDQHPLTVAKSHTLKNVVGKFLTQGLSFGIVTEGEKVVGVVTDKDVITKVDHQKSDISSTTVGSILSGPLRIIRPETSIEGIVAMSIEEHLRVLPVMKKDQLVGVITRVQLMAELDRFFSMNHATPTHVVRVEMMMDEPLTVEENTTVLKAIELMKQRRVSSALITKKRKDKEELVGIVSKKEILDELYNYRGSLGKVKVASIMNRKIRCINPGASLLEVNKVMVETGYRLLPVTLGDELVGVITQSLVMRELWNLFSEIQELENMKGWRK